LIEELNLVLSASTYPVKVNAQRRGRFLKVKLIQQDLRRRSMWDGLSTPLTPAVSLGVQSNSGPTTDICTLLA
jgi:hypothetical protein